MTVLNVEGMMCQGCVKRVTNALSELGVTGTVSLEEKKVSFEGDAETVSKVSQAIENLGFVVK